MGPLYARTIGWYEARARELAAFYEGLPLPKVHDWLLDLLPAAPGLVLDIGAGSGRDASWLADEAHEVVAVEPSAAMRSEAGRLHPTPKIRWIDDQLPALAVTSRLGLAFDMILLSAVWMHVAPAD